MPEIPRVVEDPGAISRYDRLRRLRPGSARQLMAEGVHETNPPVWAAYFEHILIAPELGRRIADAAGQRGLPVDTSEIESLLYYHDIGRLVLPGAYLRNDFVGNRLLLELGISRSSLANLPSTEKLMQAAEALKLTEEQLCFKQPLDNRQQTLVQEYFDSQNPTQRINNLADNLGKRDKNGLFNTQRFVAYLKSQEGRYGQTSDWSSITWAIPRRQAGAVLQAYTVEKTAQWLTEMGVDLEEINRQMTDYGPRFIVVARHGNLTNPKNIVYNRDSVMFSEDIMHLSLDGEEQMKSLGKLLKQRQFNVTVVTSSPEIRAQESARLLVNQVGVTAIGSSRDLDDAYAPGPYREQMTIDKLSEIGGNVYDQERWGQYHHEQPKDIIRRMQGQFWEMAKSLHTGETGVLVSHGDPIGWLINTINGESAPQPQDLRQLPYPTKGEAMIFVIHPDGSIFTQYSTQDHPPGARNTY